MTIFPNLPLLLAAAVALVSAVAAPAASVAGTAPAAPASAPVVAGGHVLSSAPAGERAYQAALSGSGRLYVTSAMGKTTPGAITVVDAATMRVTGRIAPARAATGKDRPVEVFGIAVDDRNGRVWTTNTLDSTVTVFDMATGQVEKLFASGTVAKPRDVVIDEARGRAYVNTELTGRITVFDTRTLEPVDRLTFQPGEAAEPFAALDLDLDAENGRLYAVGRSTPWVGWIDLDSGRTTGFAVPQIDTGMGVAHDPETGRIHVSGLKSRNIVTLDAQGRVLSDTPVGTEILSLAWEPKSRRLFGASRTGGTVVVLDADGGIVAELPGGDLPNHLTTGPDGAVYLVSMNGAQGDGDDTGQVTKIVPKR